MAEIPDVSTDYRFAPIPEELLYAKVTDKAVRVYAALMRHGLDPSSCYPSHKTIGALIGAAGRSIQRPLRELEDAGWVVRVPRFDARGDRQTDGFHVRTSSASTAHDSAEGTALNPHTPPRTTARTGEREPVNESQLERTLALDDVTSADRLDAWFDEWWQIYPKKSGKLAAKKSFAKVAARVVPFAKLIEAAARYRDDPNRDPKFTKDPATWLNAGCWDDEPLPSRSNGRSSNRAPIMGDESRTKTPTAEVVKW